MILSIVVPCFNEEGNIIPFTKRVREIFPDSTEYELVFVNDGSKDGTIRDIRTVMNEGVEKIRLVSFSRNFGKESAMYAGLKEATGEMVAIADADLQQDPSYIKQMKDILQKDFAVDAVCAYQEKRKENGFVALLKSCFYKFSNVISDVKMEENASDFRVLRRKVVDAILSLNEVQRFSKGIFSFVGFNTVYIPYNVRERTVGVSKWSLKALFKYAFSGITAFSVKPLKLPLLFGIMSLLVSVVLLIVFAFYGLCTEKWILISLFFIGGIILVSLGIIGEYMALTFLQGKNRPVYIVDVREENKN